MLTRDEALKICETVLGHAKAAGADDAQVLLDDSVEAHARFADNRITTSGRSEDVDITATVWVARRRGAATVNDPSADALKQVAGDAVQIARLSPVQREYVPTLGPADYAATRGFADTTANIDVTARAKTLQDILESCRAQKITGAGFHTARVSGSATATANGNRRYFRSTRAELSVTARTPDGTGSGYYSGDHFDVSRLDAQRIAREAVNKAGRSRNPQPIEPGNYPVILEPQAVADLIGTLTGAFDARPAEEGRSAFSAKDGKTHLGDAMFSERVNLYSDPNHPELPTATATNEGVPAALVVNQGRGHRQLRLLEVLGARKEARGHRGSDQFHTREHTAADLDGRDDQRHAARTAHHALLVRAPRRPSNAGADRAHA
jgi:predicted Zn-dependent protease